MNQSPVIAMERRCLILLALLMMIPALSAAASGSHEGPFNTHNGVAIKGYDPVAYFTLAKATEGSPQYSTRWNGAEWRFASAEHRDRFIADPERYAPSYGGYCAWAAANNQVADINPNAWVISDGRLYLNYNNRLHRRFEADLAANIAAADRYWPGLRAGLEAEIR